MDAEEVVARLLSGDPSLFEGETARHALGWLRHPERYLDQYLDQVSDLLPRRHQRTLLFGMGGSSSPARLYAEALSSSDITVLDTSNPDTIAAVDFANANVIASSKSGGTIETQTLLAHALAHGLEPRDLVIITDPGTALEELAYSLGAMVFLGDPDTGGRFSSISPFGLIPAMYAGWTVDGLRTELAGSVLTEESVRRAVDAAASMAERVVAGESFFDLGADPITSGGALWLEQLIAETTGKQNRGFVPVLDGPATTYGPSQMMHWHLVAALLAWHLDVDPFNQPNVESAKKDVFALLAEPVRWPDDDVDLEALTGALAGSTYNVLQAYAPLGASSSLATLRARVQSVYGTTTANLGPRYLHSTGQLHKGGPVGVVGLQIVQRPKSAPQRIEGRAYTFHDLHMAQAHSDFRAMQNSQRPVWRLMVDDLDEAAQMLGLGS
jgi:hypothetical protein